MRRSSKTPPRGKLHEVELTPVVPHVGGANRLSDTTTTNISSSDNNSSPQRRIGRSPFFPHFGATVFVLLAAVCVWSIVLIPIYDTSDVNSAPPHALVIFDVASCYVIVSRAQVSASSSDAAQAVNCVTALIHELPAPAAQAAVNAVQGSDLGALAAALVSSMPDLLDSSLQTSSYAVLTALGPLMAAVSLQATKSYSIIAAQTGNAPGAQPYQNVAASMSASALPIQTFLVGGVPSAVSAAAEAYLTQAQLDAATLNGELSINVSPPPFASLFRTQLEVLRALGEVESLIQASQQTYNTERGRTVVDDAVSSLFIALAAVVCVIGCVSVALLTRRYAVSDSYRSVIQADFDVVPDSASVVPKDSVLRALSLTCAKYSVLECSPDAATDDDDGQFMLHMRRMNLTLRALRSFLPQYIYYRGRTFDAFGRSLPRINMEDRMEKQAQCVVLVVGLGAFHRHAAVSSSSSSSNEAFLQQCFPMYVRATQDAIERYHGVVCQLSPTHLVGIFQNSFDAFSEDSINVGPNAVEASRAAFDILAVGVRLQKDHPSLTVSIGIAQGSALAGPLTTHSAKVLATASYVVTTALHIEGWNKDLSTCITCDTETATAADDAILTRPVMLCQTRNTKHHEIVADLASHNVEPGVRERCERWSRTFDKYEDAVASLLPDRLEGALSDLQAYRQYAAASVGSTDTVEDAVFQRVAAHLRRLLADLGVSA